MLRETGLLVLAMGLMFGVFGCPKKEQVPESSYDPELLAAAREAAAREEQAANAGDDGSAETASGEEAECNRDTGGCPDGSLCWDSWYCKQGRPDQCSAQGDKRCHKRCSDDSDCPEAMPRCIEKPIFKGSDRGVLEKFCVAGE